MLKDSYDSQDQIPENLRGAYVQKDGKWRLDDLDAAHPVVAHNKTLQTELSTEKGKVTRITNEKATVEAERDTLKASALPAGHVAVSQADYKKLETLSSIGKPVDELKTIVAEHADLKNKITVREKADRLKEIAQAEGYDPEKIVALADRFPDISTKEVEVNGKKEQRAFFKVKEGDKEVERTFVEHLQTEPSLKPLADSLKATRQSPRSTPNPRAVGPVEQNAVAAEKSRLRAKGGYGI